MVRERKNENWFITLPKCDLKEFWFNGFKDICKKLVVSREFHQDGSPHLHMYISLLEKLTFNEVKDFIVDGWKAIDSDRTDGGDIQPVRNVRNVILYITKFDKSTLWYGCKEGDFRKGALFKEWAIENADKNFNMADDIVCDNLFLCDKLEKLHREIKKQKNVKEIMPIYGPFLELKWWQYEILNWWNDWAINGWTHKKKQLYLYGPPNTGKTTFITDFILENGLNNDEQIFQISENYNFPYNEFDPTFHKVSFNDEFDITKINFNLWKKAVAGEMFHIERKGKNGQYGKSRIPYIMVSNIKANTNIPGVDERLFIIELTENDKLF